MANRIYLHIGAPKSGTTFLQTLLWANKDKLAGAGVLLPGRKKFDHNHVASVARSDIPSEAVLATWRRIEKEIRKWPGTVILTNEWFSMASKEQATRFVERLQPAEVHVIFTARNLVNMAPAAWQEALKLGFSTPLDDFVVQMETPEASKRWWWGTLDPALVLPKWASAVPAERIHVVTVPPRSLGPNVLWERFASVLGLSPDTCTAEGAASNESVGAESARLLQAIGPELRLAVGAGSGHWAVPYRWIRGYLSHTLLAPLGGSKIGMRTEQASCVAQRSEASAHTLRREGFDIVGDLSELATERHSAAVHPEDLSDSDVLTVAQKLIPALVGRVRDETVRADNAERRATELQNKLDETSGPGVSMRIARRARHSVSAIRTFLRTRS